MSSPSQSEALAASAPPSAGRRRDLTVAADQVVSASSSAIAAILAARALSPRDFGLFGIVFLVLFAASSLARAMVCDPVLIHPKEAEQRPGDVLGGGLAVGMMTGAALFVCAAPVLLWGNPDLGWSMVAMSLAFPFLVLQDLGRYLAFATQKPGFALALDALWTVLMVVAIFAVTVVSATLTALAVAWFGSGAIAGLLTVWHFRKHRIRPSLGWLRETWTVSWRYLLSFMASQGAVLVASITLVYTSGAAALGAVRGAMLLVRPFLTLYTAAGTARISEIARDQRRGSALLVVTARVSLLMSLLAGANAAVLLLLPDTVGHAVLGATWPQTESVLWPAGIQIVLIGVSTGPRVGLFGVRAITTVLRLEVGLMPVLAGLTVIGGILDGAVGFYWGFVAGQTVVTTCWCWALWRHINDPVVTDVRPIAAPDAL
jgi:O-antigen/teichoic acid export membrane protein